MKKYCYSLVAFVLVSLFTMSLQAQDDTQEESSRQSLPGWVEDLIPTIHGYWDNRAGYRVTSDRNEKDFSLLESRLQLDLASYLGDADLKFKGDLYGDGVMEEGDYDIREFYLGARPTDFMDFWIGRQILTWGTGDLIFINDMFPKDWQSFFIGRDTEYLKAPSDALKVSLFSESVNLDIVFTPQFDSDRYITGERISYWNGGMGEIAGENAVIQTHKPDEWIDDSELAVRLYRNIENIELAVYGYKGFWKSPGGMNAGGRAIFPDLTVIGFSVRGNILKGIGNLEYGYYRSDDDDNGEDPMINNSEMRFLAGYTQEIVKDLTGGIQYYVEHMMSYSEYQEFWPGGPSRDENRHLITLRLTKLALNQNLRLGLFGYYSPSDQDMYLRPNINYKASDHLSYEVGGNIFSGDQPHTFFGQFQDNSNVYAGVRYSF